MSKIDMVKIIIVLTAIQYFIFLFTIKDNSVRLLVRTRACTDLQGRIYGSQGPSHLNFCGPTQVWPIWPFVWKAWKYAPLVCSAHSKSIFCGADFVSTIALDLQHKLKPFLHSSIEQMTLGSFLGIYSSFVQYQGRIQLVSLGGGRFQ